MINVSLAKEWIRKTVDGDKTFSREININFTLDILEAVINVLNNHNIKYYLDFGTLLGAMRDQAFIPWDDDADITILHEEDYHKIHDVLRDIRKAKLKAWMASFHRSIINRKNLMKRDKSITLFVDEINFTSPFNPRIAVINNKHCLRPKYNGRNNVDIFFKYEHEGSMHWMVEHRLHSVPQKIIGDELIEIDFYHLKCTVPKNYDAYLTYMYEDWKTPKKDWQYYEHETCSAD